MSRFMKMVDNEDIAIVSEKLEPNEHNDIAVEDTDGVEHSQKLFEHSLLFQSKTLLEICNSSWSRAPRANNDIQPYLRGCKWSPDGTCCLSVVNNDGVHVSELPKDLYAGSVSPKRPIDVLDSVINLKEAGLVYDFCWYPIMNSSLPETCFWITTRQNAPVQMWDAYDGSLKCSYRGYNDVDEMEPALCCTFTNDCCKIIAGYKKALRTFDVERPGREYVQHNIKYPASCFATDGNLLAVGSWNTSITLYSMNETGTYKSIGKMHAHSGGVTHMKFTQNGTYLVSGARKDHRLIVWDTRFFKRPLNVLERVVDTNQRVYFDISPCENYIVSGGTDGVLRVWDAKIAKWRDDYNPAAGKDTTTYEFPLHKDCCNSVSIHPLRPILATGSGQYHFMDPLNALEDENSLQLTNNTQEQMDTENGEMSVELGEESNKSTLDHTIKSYMKYSSHTENNLVFWWIGDVL